MSINENYGELKVTNEEDEPLAKVYVKCFAKYGSGGDKFFKDGYTDIRGKFEYAQTNSNKLKDIQKFAILVFDDTLGSLTRETKPPANIEKGSADSDLGLLKPQQLRNYNNRQKNNNNN